MPLGVWINGGAILLGGLSGALAGNKIPHRISNALTNIFSLSAMSMGISLIVQMHFLSAVIMSVILGTIVGELINIEHLLNQGLHQIQRKLPGTSLTQEQTDHLISMILLFCFSGTGIFGALNSALSGDHSILISKAIMDFFTAIIFGAVAGYLVGIIAIPQIIIGTLLFLLGGYLMPLLQTFMINDFKAVGGIITLAVGLKMGKIKTYQITNMIPSFLFVFPLSYLWSKIPF